MFYIHQQTRFHVPMMELNIGFEQHLGLDAIGKEEKDNNDSEIKFKANYQVDDKDEAGNLEVQNEVDAVVKQHLFGVSSFMRTLDLVAIHAPKFPEYANLGEGNVAVEDGEFNIRMEFGSRESMISSIKSYTISIGVDYITFYAKCKGYGIGCDWLIRSSLIQKKGCWEIRRFNGKHACIDHAKLDSDTIADAIKPLVEVDPSIKVKSIIAEVQSRFNCVVSYRKAWLAKQKSISKVFCD
ncbi:hypothetical protein Ahy_B10g102492 [Arachis hypogaea]|uniref:Transposase MuDR plant domain-containing protein n=1 Tax=Arachis hypogaea TaxID=3818 RepID=A0A444X1Z8_ARAHY|nr:hypothetical protein Ahy_B10g102492 [Arachis hypogaea]